MSFLALTLLFAAAVLHATWNLLVRKAEDRLVFIWWALLAVSPLAIPVLLTTGPSLRGAWPFAFASAALEAGYFSCLAVAYGRGDFSLVYPIARGTAPLLLAAGAVLFLHERPGALGLAGLAVLALGLVVIGGGAGWSGRGTRRPRWGAVLRGRLGARGLPLHRPLLSGRRRGREALSPASYTILVFALSALLAAPPLFLLRGAGAVLAEGRRSWRRIPLVAAFSLLSYVLVLQAYTIAPVAYAGAVREVSVVLGALAAGVSWARASDSPAWSAPFSSSPGSS